MCITSAVNIFSVFLYNCKSTTKNTVQFILPISPDRLSWTNTKHKTDQETQKRSHIYTIGGLLTAVHKVNQPMGNKSPSQNYQPVNTAALSALADKDGKRSEKYIALKYTND